MMVLVSLLLAMMVGIGAAILLVRDVSAGIKSIVAPMQALGNGDLTAQVPHQGENTEIGAMADTLQVFKDALIAKKAADAAAALDAEAKIQRGQRVDGITREFESLIGEMVGSLSSASTELEASAGDADLDRGAFAGTDHHGRRGVRGSFHQCAIGGIGDRGDGLLGQRDQPPGAGIGTDGQ